MQNDTGTRPPTMEHLDPARSSDSTESGELERPRLRRRIDCAGNPEITDRRRVARGTHPSGPLERP